MHYATRINKEEYKKEVCKELKKIFEEKPDIQQVSME